MLVWICVSFFRASPALMYDLNRVNHDVEKEATVGGALFESGSRPAGELLFFACPKKSNPKKGHPDGALVLRVAAWNRGRQKARSLCLCRRAQSIARPFGLVRFQAAMLGRAITGLYSV